MSKSYLLSFAKAKGNMAAVAFLYKTKMISLAQGN